MAETTVVSSDGLASWRPGMELRNEARLRIAARDAALSVAL